MNLSKNIECFRQEFLNLPCLLFTHLSVHRLKYNCVTERCQVLFLQYCLSCFYNLIQGSDTGSIHISFSLQFIRLKSHSLPVSSCNFNLCIFSICYSFQFGIILSEFQQPKFYIYLKKRCCPFLTCCFPFFTEKGFRAVFSQMG